ncbi:MAG TPA: lipoyl(octanoyl) transferase LipB [Chitinophagales bacterium]
MSKEVIIHREAGLSNYADILKLQTELFDRNLDLKNQEKPTQNHLVFCEHNAVYTLGKHGNKENLLFDAEKAGAQFFQIDRGGDITFHGEGQLVVYPVFDLDNFGIGTATFVNLLEEAIIETLQHYDITASRLEGAPGIWVNPKGYPKKIAAVGIKVSRHVTMHGISINVSTNLSWFTKIVPCGISDKGVTSILEQTGKEISVSEVADFFLEKMNSVLK